MHGWSISRDIMGYKPAELIIDITGLMRSSITLQPI